MASGAAAFIFPIRRAMYSPKSRTLGEFAHLLFLHCNSPEIEYTGANPA
jgi:hypothetical protein